MNSELLAILESLEREKGISREVLFSAIELALASAAKKILGRNKEEMAVSVDRETGNISVLADGKEVKSNEFGRIAAQTAKQVIIQKIREAERDVVFEEYTKRQNAITSGLVHRFEKGSIIVDLGKTEAVLPRTEQVGKERYNQGDRIRAYILEVKKMPNGPQIILSRRSAEFVKKLFELEVPEILQGIVEIRGIVRDPGERTKIAVYSKDDKVDPVGSCVGMHGARVKDIVKELHGERIDIVEWSVDPDKYLRNALKPVEIKRLSVNNETKRIELLVKDDQLSIGIGKHGQNIRLISKLIGSEIDIRGEAESKSVEDAKKEIDKVIKAPEAPAEEKTETSAAEADESIYKINGVGKTTAKTLLEAGYDSVKKIAKAELSDLKKLDGIGEKTAQKILDSAKTIAGDKKE